MPVSLADALPATVVKDPVEMLPKKLELPFTARRPQALRSPASSPASSAGQPQKVQLGSCFSGYTSPVYSGRGNACFADETSLSPACRMPVSPPATRQSLRGSGLLSGHLSPPALPGQASPPELQLPSQMLRWGGGSPTPSKVEEDQEARFEGEDFGEPSPSFAQSRSGALVRFPPGLRPPPNTPSHGSVLHGDGTCRPCAWFWKPGSCKNGADCGHCHLCPEGEIKNRKKTKQTIMRLGLATPKPGASAAGESCDPFAVLTIPKAPEARAMLMGSTSTCPGLERESILCVNSDQESTTGPLSEQEILAAGSEQESDGQGTPKGESVLFLPPGLLEFPPGLPQSQSKLGGGSSLHGSGSCRPCVWFWKPMGCQHGQDCSYCHLCPDGGEAKSRKKSKAAMMRLGLATPKSDQVAEQQAKFALSLTSLL